MKYYNDICNLDPEEVYKDHCKNFSRFEDQFLSLYEKFNNKKKIINLLNYWTLNIGCIKKLYGKNGVLEFCRSNTENPHRFSFFYELENIEKINAIDNKKSNIFFYYLLKPFLKKIYVPGAKLNTPLDKLFNKLCDIYIRSIPCIENKKLKDDLFIFLTKLFGHTFDSEELNAIKTKIPTIFFSRPINTLKKNKLQVEGSCASLLEFSGYEKILLLQKIFISGYQHGGGYDIFSINYFSDYEKKLSDIFYGWGFSKENVRQTKFKKISSRASNKMRRVLWIEDGKIPSFYFYMMPLHHYQLVNQDSKNYIHQELTKKKIKYSSMSHPSSKSDLYRKYRSNDFNISEGGPSETKILKDDILIFDFSGSTLIHFAIENELIFYQIVSRFDYENFTEIQKEFFSIQRKYNFGIFNDEVSKLSNSISKIKLESNYFLPKELIEFYENNFK